MCGVEMQSWSRCRAILQLFDTNWGKRGLDIGRWFTWSNFWKGKGRVQVRLDRVYGPIHNLSFTKRFFSIDVLIEAVGSNHFPI